MKAATAHGHRAKHLSSKHRGTSKHHPKGKVRGATAHKSHVHAVAKKATGAKARGWSPDEMVACCSARAVAEAIRIASGKPVSDSAVIDLYWLTAMHENAGASILATLRAAQEYPHLLGHDFSAEFLPELRVGADMLALGHGGSLILGLDLPWGEPHSVTYDPADGAWWSWGQPYNPADFAGAVIEEAWAVTL